MKLALADSENGNKTRQTVFGLLLLRKMRAHIDVSVIPTFHVLPSLLRFTQAYPVCVFNMSDYTFFKQKLHIAKWKRVYQIF